MGDVLPFRHRSRIEIDAGFVTAGDITAEVGQHRYFLVHIDDDGNHLGIWEGASYELARANAHEWAAGFGIPVVDLIRGATA